MFKRLGVLGAALALAALSVGVVRPAVGSSGGNDDENGRRVISVLSTNTEENFVDLGDAGDSLGDEFVFSSMLKKHGRHVGHTGVVCVLTSLERAEVQCAATASFNGRGQITVQGLIAGDPQEFRLAVTGGTGDFKEAAGELHVFELSGSRERLVFHLDD